MKNVTLDFTVNKAMDFAVENQELAVMPANLAKKLLREYAQNLQRSTVYTIVEPISETLHRIAKEGSVEDAVQACVEFIQERSLIEACASEDWGKFSVNSEPKPISLRSINEL